MMFRLAKWALTSLVLMTGPAYAYIDPGTGSVVTAAIIGLFAAVAYTFRKYFYRVKDLFVSKRTDTLSPDDDKK